MRNLALTCIMAVVVSLAGCGDGKTSNEQARAEQPKAVAVENAQQILDGLMAAKLPLDNIRTVTAENDSNQLLGRPGQYTSKIDFVDRRFPLGKLDEEATNNIEVFANEADAKARYDYVDGIVKSSPLFLQYLLLKKNVLIRLNQAVTPDVAKDYEAALAKVVG